jgi:hypothetical protein
MLLPCLVRLGLAAQFLQLLLYVFRGQPYRRYHEVLLKFISSHEPNYCHLLNHANLSE